MRCFERFRWNWLFWLFPNWGTMKTGSHWQSHHSSLFTRPKRDLRHRLMSDNYVLTWNKSSSALFCSDIKTLKLCRTCSMSKQAVNDVTFFVSLLFLCCGKRYKIKNMDRDERYFLQVSNADNLHEELFGGGKVSCFMLIQSQCTQCKCNSTHLFLSHVSYYSYVSYKLSTKFSWNKYRQH